MVRRTLQQQVGEIDWYHSIALPDGTVTPGVNNSELALKRLRLPEDLTGKTVLDVGAWDGFYSFTAAGRGADRVVASDSYVWRERWGQAGFSLARRELGLEDRVEAQHVDVMDLSPEVLDGSFDIVLFLGVLYHLVDPIGALQRVASVCHGSLYLETETALNYLPFPAARVWPTSELSGDATNWWSLNERALIELLKSLNFSRVETVYRTSLARRVGRSLRAGGSLREGAKSARIVLHAHR